MKKVIIILLIFLLVAACKEKPKALGSKNQRPQTHVDSALVYVNGVGDLGGYLTILKSEHETLKKIKLYHKGVFGIDSIYSSSKITVDDAGYITELRLENISLEDVSPILSDFKKLKGLRLVKCDLQSHLQLNGLQGQLELLSIIWRPTPDSLVFTGEWPKLETLRVVWNNVKHITFPKKNNIKYLWLEVTELDPSIYYLTELEEIHLGVKELKVRFDPSKFPKLDLEKSSWPNKEEN